MENILYKEYGEIQCKNCGRNTFSDFTRHGDDLVCKACGSWYFKKMGDDCGCQIGYSYLNTYDFDKAKTQFKEIIRRYPDNIDARWGYLLAEYKIVYITGFYSGVTEPIYCFAEYDKFATRCFRGEPDYKKITELLAKDDELRYEYEEKAEKIDAAIADFKACKSSTERDVFICVKISASTEGNIRPKNERTRDYEFAQNAYKDLKKRGMNPFFSYVTLKNDVKADEKIWLNLVKSKKMLLIGSCADYLESPWVKSEWKRWLYLGRGEKLYIYAMNDGAESPQDILPTELDGRQIYTRDTYQKLLSDICEEAEETEEEKFARWKEQIMAELTATPTKPQTAPTKPQTAPTKPQTAPTKPLVKNTERQDGEIVYKDGRTAVLKYSVTDIIYGCYSKDKDIVSIVLPSNVRSIGDYAFSYCTSLSSITIPSGVTSIGKSAFSGCSSLNTITIPSGVTAIGEYSFCDCTSLSSITIQGSVKSINQGAFYSCNNLSSITIPEGATYIGDAAFFNCNSLKSITIPGSVTSIGDSAFGGCYRLKDIYYGGTKEDWKKIRISLYNEKLEGNLFKRAKIHYNCK